MLGQVTFVCERFMKTQSTSCPCNPVGSAVKKRRRFFVWVVVFCLVLATPGYYWFYLARPLGSGPAGPSLIEIAKERGRFGDIAEDKRAKIKDYLNREIWIENTFAGESITLIEENGDFFVLRKIFGSGVPVIRTMKYKAVFYSDWQIRFPETTDDSGSERAEYFILGVGDKGLNLFLNGLQVVIDETQFANN